MLLGFQLLELLERDGEGSGSQADQRTRDGDAGDDQWRVHASTARSSALRTAPAGASFPVQI